MELFPVLILMIDEGFCETKSLIYHLGSWNMSTIFVDTSLLSILSSLFLFRFCIFIKLADLAESHYKAAN